MKKLWFRINLFFYFHRNLWGLMWGLIFIMILITISFLLENNIQTKYIPTREPFLFSAEETDY